MISPRQLSRIFVLLIGYLLLTISSCSSPQPAAPTAAPAISSGSVEDTSSPATAVPVVTEETASTAVSTPQPNQSRSATQMRSYAPDAGKLMSMVNLNQSQPLQAGVTVTGRITPNALAIPYTYTAQAGDVLLVELLLPDLPDADMQTIRPAIFVAGAGGNEIGYMRGGQDFVSTTERRSIARAGFIAPSDGDYTILATLDGHQNPQQNPVYEAGFALTVTPALSLTVNEAHEATRDSTERHVYAVTTAVGEFDIVYEEIGGEPPGQYAINVYRLGGPADGMALASSMAATYPSNFTIPFSDNAYASIAETMGLEELTYLITVDSFRAAGQEETTYASNYRLTVAQQEPAAAAERTATVSPTAAPGPIAGNETWETRLNHTMRVQFQIPAGWEVASGNNTFYGRDGASLEMSFADYPYEGSPPFADAAGACQGLTQGITAAAFGTGTGEVVSVNGLDVCVISHPQSGEPYRAIIKYPEPVELTGTIGPRGIWNFLNIEIEPADYFWPIVESITFPDEPSVHLYASGVLDILKAHYYFRDQLDWAALEAGLDARLENDSSLDDAYEALRWLIEEIAAAVNHHHMHLDTPEQVQVMRQGQRVYTGLHLSGDVISLVAPGSPADLAGLQIGDRIITINGAPLGEADLNVTSYDVLLERSGDQFRVTLVPAPVSQLISPRGQRLGNVAYLETFGYGSGPMDTALLQTYATTVHATMSRVDAAGTCGWILDLRRNAGGSLHAVLAGIAPFVGNGELYHLRWPDGNEDTIYYQNGRIFGIGITDRPALVNTPYSLTTPDPPLAVLVDSGTASAGEMSAIIVSGRPNSRARIFGEQTPGLTTPVFYANLYDGGLFYAPMQLVVDLEGRTYLEGVIPDEEVTVVYDSRYGTEDDPVVQAALDWLESEHGCSP